MAPCFVTQKGRPSVEVPGAGFAGANQDGSIPLDRAALVVHELQDADGKPLSGNALQDAAEKWGAQHGLDVRQNEPAVKAQPEPAPEGAGKTSATKSQEDK